MGEEVTLLPGEHLFELSTDFELLATEAEVFKHTPVDLFGINDSAALLHGKEVLKGHLL